MSTEQLKPKGEKLRMAIKWISETCKENPEKERKKVIREAEMKFDLSPRECEFLNEKFV
jgi:hypothetical protein